MATSFIIGNLEQEVLLKCENKTSDLTRVDVWIRDAILEITSNPSFRNEFDDLEEYGQQMNMVPRQQEYAESLLVPGTDWNTATLDILIWQDPPTNQIRRKLLMSHYQKADNFQPTFSLPTEWYRFAHTIGFTPVPDKAYQIQTRMLKQHPFSTPLNQTPILIPNDWNEILVYAAVERGFIEYMEYEKAQKVHMLLYGDPKEPQRPGLIEGRKKRREMEMWRTEGSLRPVYRSVCRK